MVTHVNDGSKAKTQIYFIGVSGNPEILQCLVDNEVSHTLDHPLRSDHFPVVAEIRLSFELLCEIRCNSRCPRLIGWTPLDLNEFGEKMFNGWRSLNTDISDAGAKLAKLQMHLVAAARTLAHGTTNQNMLGHAQRMRCFMRQNLE